MIGFVLGVLVGAVATVFIVKNNRALLDRWIAKLDALEKLVK